MCLKILAINLLFHHSLEQCTFYHIYINTYRKTNLFSILVHFFYIYLNFLIYVYLFLLFRWKNVFKVCPACISNDTSAFVQTIIAHQILFSKFFYFHFHFILFHFIIFISLPSRVLQVFSAVLFHSRPWTVQEVHTANNGGGCLDLENSEMGF